MADYRLVVLSNARAGRDADFNDWYDHQHIRDVLAVPGFHRAQRMAIETPLSDAEPDYRYAAIYDFETDDLAKTFDYFFSATNTDKMPISDALDGSRTSMHVCRVLGPAVERNAPTARSG